MKVGIEWMFAVPSDAKSTACSRRLCARTLWIPISRISHVSINPSADVWALIIT